MKKQEIIRELIKTKEELVNRIKEHHKSWSNKEKLSEYSNRVLLKMLSDDKKELNGYSVGSYTVMIN